MRTLLLLVLLTACQTEPGYLLTGPVVVHPDLVYTTVGDANAREVLLLDLYLPADVVNPPLIVYAHGGGWQEESKQFCPGPQIAAVGGFAAACINYRLSGTATFPAQIYDYKAAVRWLRANAPDYGVDVENVGAWGSSAGGHLAALLGTSGGIKALEGSGGASPAAVSSRVQAVVDWFGPTDFTRVTKAVNEEYVICAEKLVGGPIAQRPRLVKQANPITHVTRDDPPFLIMHGAIDRTVPVGQSRLLHKALRTAGVPSQLEIVPKTGHGFHLMNPDDGLPSEELSGVMVFFSEHL